MLCVEPKSSKEALNRQSIKQMYMYAKSIGLLYTETDNYISSVWIQKL